VPEPKPVPTPDQKPVPAADQKPVPAPEQKPVPAADQKPLPSADEKPVPTAQSIAMNFKDTPYETVLEQLSEMSGLVIVKDFTLEGRVTIISKQKMNVDEAIALLNSMLKEKGYVGIRTGKILKLVKIDEAKKRNIPVKTGADPLLIEANDDVITQVIPIRFLDATQLKKDFAPLIPSYADLSANSGSNTLILTDTGANIRRIVEIIRAMDTQSTVVAEVKVFQLKYANATSAARLINDTFKVDEQGAQQQSNLPPWMRGGGMGFRGGGGGPFGQPGGGAQADGDNKAGARVRKVTASADERTNTVVVSASPETLVVIGQVIKDLDSNPAEEQGVFTYRCKNAQAGNLEAVINALFSTTGSTVNRSASTQRSNTGVGQNVQRSSSSSRLPGSSTTSTLGSNTSGQRSSGFGQGGFGGFGGFGGANANNRGTTGGSDMLGQVYVVADTDSNSLIVLTSPKNFERVKVILTELDRPVPQVLIKVLIAEVTHEKGDDIGVEASVLSKGTIKSALTDFGVAAATGGFITKIVSGDVTVALRALETIGKLDILSRPYILASDNQLSSITVGQEVPFVISSRTTDTGQTINTIQYQDIGIILNVTAHINDEGLVIMDVAPEVSSLTGTTVPISDNVSAPVFAKRSAQSRVGIKDGQTIVIGGMMEDRKTENVKAVPILGRLPGIGTLFRRRTTDKSKTELLIFLTPHVAHEPGRLKPMTKDEEAGLKLVPKAVKPGAYEEHMEGMERGGEFVPLEEAPAVPKPAPSIEPQGSPEK
jgi:general secretion pathway protein D